METRELGTEPWGVERKAFSSGVPAQERAHGLLRYAILAPSSHNTQPWSFAIDADEISVRADAQRWLQVADRDRRELHLSLGCALENLLIAAQHHGLDPAVDYEERDGGADVAKVTLGDTAGATFTRPAALFDAIPRRRTSHGDFEPRDVPEAVASRFHDLVVEDAVELHLIDDLHTREVLAELQLEADQRQMSDKAYRKELGEWLGGGLLGDAWPKARISQLVVTFFNLGKKQGADNATYIREAPLLALLATADDGQRRRVEAGQVYERIALAATLADVANHPMSQILEVPDLKRRLGEAVGLSNAVPQHLFRLGYASSEEKHTPRWPVERFVE